MILRIVMLRARASILLGLAVCQTALAQQPPLEKPSPAPSIPPGPFASWPEEARKKVVATLAVRCTMASVMQMGNYQGNIEAAKQWTQASAMACLDHQMPDDWPGHAEAQTREQKFFEAARQLDPALPDPEKVWTGILSKPQR